MPMPTFPEPRPVRLGPASRSSHRRSAEPTSHAGFIHRRELVPPRPFADSRGPDGIGLDAEGPVRHRHRQLLGRPATGRTWPEPGTVRADARQPLSVLYVPVGAPRQPAPTFRQAMQLVRLGSRRRRGRCWLRRTAGWSSRCTVREAGPPGQPSGPDRWASNSRRPLPQRHPVPIEGDDLASDSLLHWVVAGELEDHCVFCHVHGLELERPVERRVGSGSIANIEAGAVRWPAAMPGAGVQAGRAARGAGRASPAGDGSVRVARLLGFGEELPELADRLWLDAGLDHPAV